MSISQCLFFTLCTVCCPGFSGCDEDEFHWLPESSGIILTDKFGTQVIRYELEKKKTRVVAADTNSATSVLGLREDGKQFVVATDETRFKVDSEVRVCSL